MTSDCLICHVPVFRFVDRQDYNLKRVILRVMRRREKQYGNHVYHYYIKTSCKIYKTKIEYPKGRKDSLVRGNGFGKSPTKFSPSKIKAPKDAEGDQAGNVAGKEKQPSS